MNRAEALVLARNTRQKNIPPLEKRFWSKVKILSFNECWPWIAAVRRSDEGYGAFWYEGRHRPSNRMAWELIFSPIPDGYQACHKCDNPKCCNPLHLFLATNKGNNDDKVRKHRHAFGEKNGFSKLTDKTATEIKKLKLPGRAPNGYRQAIAAQFSVSPATITDVWSRRWKHLD
jgi:hypothetical protein